MRGIISISMLSLALVACGGGGGGGGSPAAPAPVASATLTATAKLNGKTDLSWTSANTTNCVLSGSAQGNVPVTGTQTVTAPVIDDQKFTLTCSGNYGNAVATATATPPNSFSTVCDESTIPETAVWANSFIFMNNLWGYNSNKANSPVNHTQCISSSVASDGTVQAKWNWNFDFTQGIKSYPSFAYGAVSNGWSSSTKNLPAAVNTLSPTFGLTYSQTVTNVADGSAYNFLVDLYFNKSSDINNDLEMSINQVCVNACYGPIIDTFVLNGVSYQVNYGIGGGGKAQLSFSSMSVPHSSGTLVFKPFIDYAIAHGYMTANWNLGQITVGNEVYAGTGDATLTAKFIP